ncbi:hypothetical protein QJ854_gp488 [Moumouvirus goulette]|uniref:Glycosyltransferase n=1 Tax=Moumouvirus goulette TaxID=1247379 RepID=M1PBI4_9VIRU|nr:hypothetical protein QJ854_gp488 [Moumouvirus goulette]AGF85294.1 hypothetical protein glt_00485 [Moumouvirus goulette]
MIPNILHQIWIQGYEKIPNDLKKYHINCQKVNNNFEHVLWDDDKIRKLLIDKFGPEYLETYDYFKVPAQKADFARYAILYTYGGIYLDMDMVCRKNLESLLQYNFFLTPQIVPLFTKSYLNAIIGSRKNHPIFKIIFKNIFFRKNLKNNIRASTGTGLFYDSIIEYIKKNPIHDITLIDRKYLQPCNMYNGEMCPYTCTDCYVAHTNYSSWSWSLKFWKKFFKYFHWILFFLLILIIILLVIKCKFI